MPKTTNALHRDQITAAQTCVAKSVVGRDTRTEEWSSLHGSEFVGNRSDSPCFGDHHLGVSSVNGNSRDDWVLTIDDVSASARFAHAVLAAEEPDTDPLTDFPFGHSAAQGFNAANYFMPWPPAPPVSSRAIQQSSGLPVCHSDSLRTAPVEQHHNCPTTSHPPRTAE